MQNIKIQDELYEGLHRPERAEAATLMSQLSQKDINEGNMIWSIEVKAGIKERKLMG